MRAKSEKPNTPSLYVLKFQNEQRRKEIFEQLERAGWVSEAIETFPTQGTGRLYVALVWNPQGEIAYVCRMIRFQTAAFHRITVGLSELTKLKSNESSLLIAAVKGALTKKRKEVPLQQLAKLSPQENKTVIETLDKYAPDLANLLREKGQADDRALKKYSDHERTIIGLERDCLGLALDIAFGERDALIVDSRTGKKFQNFLAWIPRSPLIEDEVISYDKQRYPGLDKLIAETPRRTVFEHNGSQLEIVHANRNDLEHTLGVDLIYISHYFNCFIGVQYKMLENKGSQTRYRPDSGLKAQLGKMKDIQRKIRTSPPTSSHRDYRLSTLPFYFKFVSRLETNLVGDALCPGLYLPFNLVERISTDRPSYVDHEATRHLTNTEFANLFRNGWIGSTTNQSESIRKLIEMVLDSNRSLTVAIDPRSSPKERGRSRRKSIASEIRKR